MRHKIKRQVDRLNGHKLAAVFIIAIFLFAAASFIRARQTAQADLHICRSLNHRFGQLAKLVAASDRALGKPGTSGYAYYRANPDELAAAHRANRVVIVTLGPENCHRLPSLNSLP